METQAQAQVTADSLVAQKEVRSEKRIKGKPENAVGFAARKIEREAAKKIGDVVAAGKTNKRTAAATQRSDTKDEGRALKILKASEIQVSILEKEKINGVYLPEPLPTHRPVRSCKRLPE